MIPVEPGKRSDGSFYRSIKLVLILMCCFVSGQILEDCFQNVRLFYDRRLGTRYLVEYPVAALASVV